MVTPHKNLVLIIDDNLNSLKIVVTYLNQQGIQTITALDGQTGLKRAQVSQPDLILLDVVMPGINGFDICRQIKANETIRHIPVIFLTALGQPEEIVQGFAVGGVDYVVKPVRLEELLARVNAHLALKKLQQELQAEITGRQTVKTNKAIIHRYVAELNRRNLAILDELVAEEITLGDLFPQGETDTVISREQYRQEILGRITDAPDYQVTIEGMVAEDDRVVLFWRKHWTHQNEYQGIPPSGQEIHETAVTIYRLAQGQIVEVRGYWDKAEIWRQLGFTLPPGEDPSNPPAELPE